MARQDWLGTAAGTVALAVLTTVALGLLPKKQAVPSGAIVVADGQAQAAAGQVLLDVSVLSQANASRLFVLDYALTGPGWLRTGSSLLREILPGQVERYGLNELNLTLSPGDLVQVDLVLASRPLTSGVLAIDDSQNMILAAI